MHAAAEDPLKAGEQQLSQLALLAIPRAQRYVSWSVLSVAGGLACWAGGVGLPLALGIHSRAVLWGSSTLSRVGALGGAHVCRGGYNSSTAHRGHSLASSAEQALRLRSIRFHI